MKKLIATLGATALMTIMPAAPAMAEGATVTTEGACFGFIPTEEGGVGDGLVGTLHSVVTKNGSTSLVCKFTFEPGLIPRAYKATGFDCNTLAGFTNNSMMIANPDGYATLTCKINASKPA